MKQFFKKYWDEIGVVLLSVILFFFSYKMMTTGYKNPFLGTMIATMFDQLWPLILALFGLGTKAIVKRENEKAKDELKCEIEKVQNMVDRRGKNQVRAKNKGRRKDDNI